MIKALLLLVGLFTGFMVLNGTLDVSDIPTPLILFGLFSAGMVLTFQKI